MGTQSLALGHLSVRAVLDRVLSRCVMRKPTRRAARTNDSGRRPSTRPIRWEGAPPEAIPEVIGHLPAVPALPLRSRRPCAASVYRWEPGVPCRLVMVMRVLVALPVALLFRHIRPLG